VVVIPLAYNRTMEKEWSRHEKLIASSIEQTVKGPLIEIATPEAIAMMLTQEIMSTAKLDENGRSFAPDQYTMSLNPLDFDYLRQRAPDTHSELSAALLKAFKSSDLSYAKDPQVTLATDPTLARDEIRIIAWHSQDPIQVTKQVEAPSEETPARLPAGAFLIVEGKRHFPLSEDEISIGRRLDNHLILEDKHVSRTHARLEVAKGRFVLTDLNSTAGTRVNGRLITRHVLNPGDIISIAAIQLIYGEDPQGPPDVTPPYKPRKGKADTRDQITPLETPRADIKPTAPYNKTEK
jgi:hypothetical protein